MYLKPKGNKIAQRRQELGLSRYALSKKAGLGKYALARMEEGLHYVHPLRAKAVAEQLGENIDVLFESIKEDQLLTKVAGM